MMRHVPAVLASGLLISPAIASEGSGNPFAGDIGNALWTVVIFVIVLVVLGKFAWGPILSALQNREDFIRDSLDQAKKDRDDAEARLKEYTDRLEASRAEATEIVDEGRRDAEVVKKKIEADAKREADRMLERAKREIEIATDTAVKELYDLSGRLALDVASRVIQKELSDQDHGRLIQESLEEMSRVGRP